MLDTFIRQFNSIPLSLSHDFNMQTCCGVWGTSFGMSIFLQLFFTTNLIQHVSHDGK